MSKKRSGIRHRQVTQLEPSRRASTIAAVFGFLLFGALAAAVFLYRTPEWPDEWRFDPPPPDRWVLVAGGVLAGLALLCLLSAIVNGRRWRLARRIERWSNDPRLTAHLPAPEAIAPPSPPPSAVSVPPLTIDVVTARKLPKPRVDCRRVTSDANIFGRPPLRIAYLRLFENRPRTRTFVEGAWRELGRVYFLRSAGSVTPKEFKQLGRGGDVAGMFITSRQQLVAELERPERPPLGKGRHVFQDVGPSAVKVRDRYGCYPMTSLLCHGSFWKEAVDVLLERVDLVALDLSGLRERNEATRYELQRVIDRFPVERLVLLVDEQSNRKWLEVQIRDVWSRMTAGSPNAVGGPRRVLLAITDRMVRSQSTTTTSGPNGTTTTSGPVQVRLVARRKESRRLVAVAQDRIAS
ncbi:MAG: hypothetical protein ABW195_00300 [Ilumatobacteraceae bacterium]